MVPGFEAWPKCPQCGGCRFERRPFVSDDNICLNCGYVSKAAESGREPVDQPVEDESVKEPTGEG